MNLKEQVAQLKTSIFKLPSREWDFAGGLIAQFEKRGTLSPKQEFWIGKLLAQTTGEATKREEKALGFDLSNLVAMFKEAKTHLKYPSIVVEADGVEFRFSPAGDSSNNPGGVYVKADRVYLGVVTAQGTWRQSSVATELYQKSLDNLLLELAIDPAGVASKHGALTGKCCFCNSKLTDDRSTAVGYGPVCAAHYGLKSKWDAAADKVAA